MPIADILRNYLDGNGLLSHPLIRSFGNAPDIRWKSDGEGRPKVRILEVGGAPFWCYMIVTVFNTVLALIVAMIIFGWLMPL